MQKHYFSFKFIFWQFGIMDKIKCIASKLDSNILKLTNIVFKFPLDV